MGWLWDDRLAEIWAWPAEAGSGVGFGARGVLAARHVVAKAVEDSQPGRVLARLVRRGEASSPWVPMRVVADDPDWDLAVLEVDQTGLHADTWVPPNSSSPTVVAVATAAEVGCEAVGFPDEDVQRGEGSGPGEDVRQTEQVWGTLLPMGQAKPPVALQRRLPRQWMPLDVSSATPAGQTGWGGMSGAGVLLRDGRLIGVVVAAEAAHQQRRLYVVPLGTAIVASPSLTQGLATVAGGPVVVEPRHAGVAVSVLAVGWPVGQLTDPFAFEVHPAIDAGAKASGLPELPTYIERDHDAQLRATVARAASGRSAIAVLVGGSSTGKTRACWETIQSLPEGWRLWHPIDPGRPTAAIKALPQIGPHTVVWLNETHHYLLTRPSVIGEEVAAGLRELLRDPGRAPVLVLGTIWPEYWAALTADPLDRGPEKDEHAQARALLTGTDISVPEAFIGAALDAVRDAAVSDPRLDEASIHAQDGHITQFLAGAPVLLERYRNAPPVARALIETAIDARRLGHGLVLPHALLKAAAPGYLSDQEWDALGENWLEEGLVYAAAPSRGARGPLTRIHPRPDQSVPAQPRYRLSDYLEQTGRTTRRAVCAPGALWDALLAHADRDDLPRLAGEARGRGLYQYAFRLYIAAAEAGHDRALEGVARLLADLDRQTEAINWLETRAEAGEPRALYWAGWLSEPEYLDSTLVEVVVRGSAEEALTFYQRAAEAGDADAVKQVASSLEDLGRTEEALAWLLPSVDTDDITELETIARLLEDVGREEESQAFQRRADAILDTYDSEQAAETASALARLRPRAEAGDLEALKEVATLLWRSNSNSTEAITLYQRAAEIGDTAAWGDAAWRLNNAGRRAEAITWLQAASEAGHTGALYPAAQMLERDGRAEEAVSFYQRAAEAGNPYALEQAAQLLAACAHTLREAGRTEEALSFYQRAAEAGNSNALNWAASLLKESGRTEEAVRWLQTRIDAGEIDAAVPMGWLLNEAGRYEEASHLLGWLQARAASGDVNALGSAAALLHRLDRNEEAVVLYLRLAETGNTDALREAALLLSLSGRAEEGQQLRRYGLEPGGRIATSWSVVSPRNPPPKRPAA